VNIHAIRAQLVTLARNLIGDDQYVIVVVMDKVSLTYATENFDPSVLPKALRELADKIEAESSVPKA
jgi:hypothetical protein